MTLADMEAIETSADNHDLTTGDICGVHAEQLSYSWNGSAWNALPQGADELGDMYLIEYWYGTLDGKVYDGEVQAQIIYKEAGSDVVFDLYLDTTILLDNSVTDNKIGTRALTDAAGTDVLTPAEGKSFTAWLQGIRNNLKYALNTLLGKQNVITATGSDNVLTAPSVAGDQPGTVAKASLYGQQFAVFPDYNARSSIGTLTIPETGAPDTDWQSNTITVSQSGYIMLDGRAKVSSGFVYRGVIIINGKTVWSSDVDGVMTWVDYAQGPFPVSAGDTAQIRMGLPVASPSWNNRAITCYFVPPKVALMQASPAMANSLTTMGPPDYSRQEATNRITSNNGTWTVDRNGYVRVQIQAMSAASACCEINGRRVGQNYSGVSAGSQAFLADVYPVKTGDVVKLFVDADVATNILCNYIPPVINPPLYVDGGALVNYSTIEQDTGIKWLDGKTIYQRTLTGTKDVSANLNTVLVTVTGVERLIKGEGVVSRGASSFVTIPCRTVDASEAAGHLVGDITQATGGSIAVTIRSDVAITGAYYAVTLQYTKP